MATGPTANLRFLLVTSTSLYFVSGMMLPASAQHALDNTLENTNGEHGNNNRKEQEKTDEPGTQITKVVEGHNGSSTTAPFATSDDKTTADRRASSGSETIIVTGSHIRGVDTSVGNQIISIDRQEIDRQNYATVRDLVEDLPQNFGGGATGEIQANAAAANNTGSGTTVNLRGLGGVATLTLVNGRRLPGSGYRADMSDISGIPLSAIERVEVLPDGASAVYGADAVAGVVNLILRKDYSGFETRARLGTATGTKYDEYQLSQAGGFDWKDGSAILSYEFNHQDRFRRTDRSFTESADLRRFGGGDYRVFAGNPANILDPETFSVAFAIPKNQNGRNLTRDQLLGPEFATITDPNRFGDTFPEERRHSVYTYISQSIANNLNVFIEGRYSDRNNNSRRGPQLLLITVPSSNPFYVNAFDDNQPLFVYYSFENVLPTSHVTRNIDTVSGTFGVDWEHNSAWSSSAYFSYANEKIKSSSGDFINPAALLNAVFSTDPDTAFNPFGQGPVNDQALINSLLINSKTKLSAKIYQTNLTVSGDLFNIVDNTVKTAFGGEYRVEDHERDSFTSTSPLIDSAYVERRVDSLFAEIYIPFVSPDNYLGWVNRFTVSVSARYEHFKDSTQKPLSIKREPQSSTNPRFGALFSPLKGLNLRGNYGTSFRAPGLGALTSPPFLSSFTIPDPLNPVRHIYGMAIEGASLDLKNETADTWSIGVELTSEITKFIDIRVNYFDIDFRNRVGQPTFDLTTAFTDPAYAAFLVKNPSLDVVQSTCSAIPIENQSLGPGDCSTPGLIDFIYDTRFTNLSRSIVNGIDVDVKLYVPAGSYGSFNVQAIATYIFDFKEATTKNSPLVERVNTPGNPVKMRGRASITWESADGLSANTDINYTADYRDELRNRKISSWTTLDLGISYNFDRSRYGNFLGGTSLRITVNNVFNNSPPFYEDAAQPVAYDSANADPYGRTVALNIIKNW